MRSRSTVLFALLFVLLPAAPAFAQMTPGINPIPLQGTPLEEPGVGIRLLDVPAATQNDPRARSYVVDHLQPGTTIERRIQVANGTDSIQSLQLYASAASLEDNAFLGATGKVENDLTIWTSLDQSALTLAPGVSAEVLVTVDVPADAPEGEQYAVLWAQVQPTSGTQAEGIVNTGRVGVRMYVSVGPGNGPATDFTIDSLAPSRNRDGAPELSTTVTNTGGRALDISGSLTLADGPAGLSSGPTPIDSGTTIAPGDSAPVSVTLPAELPNGPWQATLELKSGLVSHDAKATITFPDTGQGTAVPPDRGLSTTVILAAVVFLVVSAAILWWARLRHRVRN